MAVNLTGNYSQPSITVSAKTHDDSTPLRLKVDLQEKKKLNQKELQKQIIDNEKAAEVLKTRLKKIT